MRSWVGLADRSLTNPPVEPVPAIDLARRCQSVTDCLHSFHSGFKHVSQKLGAVSRQDMPSCQGKQVGPCPGHPMPSLQLERLQDLRAQLKGSWRGRSAPTVPNFPELSSRLWIWGGMGHGSTHDCYAAIARWTCSQSPGCEYWDEGIRGSQFLTPEALVWRMAIPRQFQRAAAFVCKWPNDPRPSSEDDGCRA